MEETEYDLSPAAVWQRSPLDQNAVRRVFQAPGTEHPLAVSGLDLDSWELVLAIHAWESANDFALQVNKATVAECNAVGAALRKLQDAIARLEFTNCQAPTIPDDYLADIATWKQQAAINVQVKHARAAAERNVLEPLLAIYQSVFGRLPSGSEHGPTARFVRAFLTEMHSVVRMADWRKKPSSNSRAPALHHLFSVPPPATLRSQIDNSQPDEETRLFVSTYYWAMYRQLTSQASGIETVGLHLHM